MATTNAKCSLFAHASHPLSPSHNIHFTQYTHILIRCFETIFLFRVRCAGPSHTCAIFRFRPETTKNGQEIWSEPLSEIMHTWKWQKWKRQQLQKKTDTGDSRRNAEHRKNFTTSNFCSHKISHFLSAIKPFQLLLLLLFESGREKKRSWKSSEILIYPACICTTWILDRCDTKHEHSILTIFLFFLFSRIHTESYLCNIRVYHTTRTTYCLRNILMSPLAAPGPCSK